MNRPLAVTLLLLPWLAAGCDELRPFIADTDNPFVVGPLDTDSVEGGVQVTPTTLVFDIAASETPVDKVIQLINNTDEDMIVRDLRLENAQSGDRRDAFRLPPDLLFMVVPAGETRTLPVTFDPPHGGHFEASIPLTDSAERDLTVRVVADASGPTPTLSTEIVEATRAYCTNEASVLIENAGPDEMPVYDVTLGAEPGCEGFRLQDDAVQALKSAPIAASDFARLPVDFQPRWAGRHSCTLSISTGLPEPVSVLLLGEGRVNDHAVETWQTSDGSGAHMLLVHDDEASDVAGHRAKIRAGVGNLLESLATEGVDYRVAAASTESVCPYTFAAPPADMAEADQLVDTLFDPGTEWARKPLALTADSVSRGRNSCFGGWLSGSDPVHVVVISARDDVSGRTPGTWVSQMRSEGVEVHISTITPRSGCGPTTSRLDEAATSTEGQTLDLCASSWDGHWASLALNTADMRRETWSHQLLAKPVPESVRVSVSGIATESWILGGELGRTLSLQPDFPDGAKVEVEYVDAGTCR